MCVCHGVSVTVSHSVFDSLLRDTRYTQTRRLLVHKLTVVRYVNYTPFRRLRAGCLRDDAVSAAPWHAFGAWRGKPGSLYAHHESFR